MHQDPELLRRYAEDGSEPAFTELVSRHLDLVYHAALRQTGGDARRAEEVAQAVFIDLARKAASLARRPSLAGWLHTSTRFAAANLRRAEHRRRAHENEAHALNAPVSSPAETPWERLRPVIDDALHELAARDREAVLLRFFEGLPFAAIGEHLSVSQDAARVRVERALEKIRRSLSRRGVTSTAAALAETLACHGVAAAPLGLAARIGGASLAAGAGTGAGVAGITLFALMNTPKTVAVTSGLLLLAVGVAIHQGVEAQKARARLAASQNEHAALNAKVDELRRRLDASAARVRAAEDEGATLLAAMETAAKANAAENTPPTTTLDELRSRYVRGKSLALEGKNEAALAEFLWCLDEGVPTLPAAEKDSATNLRIQLASGLAQLGRNHPPAAAALRERRDRVERTLLANAAPDSDTGSLLASFNNLLGENERTLRIHDQLQPGDIRREVMESFIFEPLAQSRRYVEASRMKPRRLMLAEFEQAANRAERQYHDYPNAEKDRREARDRAVRLGLLCAEVLAGVGELGPARSMADTLLVFDGTPTTRTGLQQALARAGQPGLLDSPAPETATSP